MKQNAAPLATRACQAEMQFGTSKDNPSKGDTQPERQMDGGAAFTPPANVDYQGYQCCTEAEAKQLFERRYGQPPAQTGHYTGRWWCGPVPEGER